MNNNDIILSGSVAYMAGSQSAVYFALSDAAKPSQGKTALPVKKLQNILNVAYWGEENRFPQNIERLMSYCGLGKAALDWKARAIWGKGIIPGKVTGFKEDGSEIFTPLDFSKYKEVYNFLRQEGMNRFWVEYLQDWTWFANCFPEIILTKDGSKIAKFVHQESCDVRYKQINYNEQIQYVFLSKLWGAAADYWAQFDPKKRMLGLIENPPVISEVDNEFVKALPCIDMYNAAESLLAIAEGPLKNKKYKSAILPVNYPSPNKVYYQSPIWDGARLGGWIEIAVKIPNIVKTMYNNAFNIKYHIQIPETYFERRYGAEVWQAFTEDEQIQKRKALLKEMNDFLQGSDNAYKSFLSFFDVDPHTKTEYGLVKIESIENKINMDKDLMATHTADLQILAAMGIHPSLFTAGMAGNQKSGGSDIREAKLVYDSMLAMERQIVLEPLQLVKNFNKWDEDIEFRFRDVQLVTLDTGSGTKNKLS